MWCKGIYQMKVINVDDDGDLNVTERSVFAFKKNEGNF